MSNAGAVRAGGAFVEIFANDSKFQQAMVRVTNKIRTVGQTMQRMGTGMSLTGAGLGAPLVLAGRQAAGFEDAILGMRSAANLSEEQIATLTAAAKKLGDEMGISPTKIANSFLSLAKAGVTVEDVLGGAGRAAVEFARVGGVEVSRAADFMFSAMNIFGASANQAVDTLVSAANASPASIETLVESFAQVGSAGANFGQSIFDVSQSLAVLARAGIVGEEAGTAVKTMLTKLVAPTQDAQEALAVLGLTMADFRDASGKMLPMQQIAGVFQNALKGMGDDPASLMESQQALVDVFEQRGIKVMTAFANAGVEGFKAVGKEMTTALPVSEQFDIMMSGLTGSMESLNASVEQVSIAFGKAVAGPFAETVESLRGMLKTVQELIQNNPVLAQTAAAVAAGLVAIGTAAIAVSLAVKSYGAIATVLGVIAKAAMGAAAAMKAFSLTTVVAAAVANPLAAIAGVTAAGAALGLIGHMIASSFSDAEQAIAGAEEKIKAAKDAAAAPARQNAVEASENRRPMDKAILMQLEAFKERERIAKENAEQLAKEDEEFENAQQKAVATIQEMSNSIVGEMQDTVKELSDALAGNIGDLGDAAFNAAVEAQDGLREVVRQIEAGILNSEGAKVLADRVKAQFDANMNALKEANKVEELKPRDFGPSMGGFGAGPGFGIGPRLAEAMRDAVPAQANLPDPRDQQMQQKWDAIINGVKQAAGVGAPQAALSTSLDKLIAQVAQQTATLAKQTPILEKIATGVANGGMVFA